MFGELERSPLFNAKAGLYEVMLLSGCAMQWRSKGKSRVVLLNFSGVQALDGGGLGMLIFLQMWTHDRGIQLKVFDPAAGVRRSLERTRSAAAAIEIAAMGEVLSLLSWGLEESRSRIRRRA